MRLPLFVQTLPFPTDSITAILAPGEYEVELDNVDAILNLSVNGEVHHDLRNGHKFQISTRTPVRASIVQAGKEKHISLYLNDNQPEHA